MNLKMPLSGFGATDVKVNTSGTMDLNFNGQPITLKPHFDIETRLTIPEEIPAWGKTGW